MPTIARKYINKYIERFSQEVKGRVLFVGVNYQWEEHYRKLMPGLVTLDIKKNVLEPDIYGDIQRCAKLRSDWFDGVIMVGIWELLDNYELVKYEIQRVLKKGGKLLFGFPGESFHNGGWDVVSVTQLLNGFFRLENMEVVYYKSELPFYIVGIATK